MTYIISLKNHTYLFIREVTETFEETDEINGDFIELYDTTGNLYTIYYSQINSMVRVVQPDNDVVEVIK